MNLPLQKILLTCSCTLLMMVSLAQVSLTVYPAQINKDEYCTLKISVENAANAEKVLPPSLNDFLVLSGPNQENGMSSVNGKVTKFAALSYVLKPRHVGTIKIGPAMVTIGGKNYKTNGVTVVVNNSTSGTTGATNIPRSMLPGIGFDPFASNRPTATFNDYIFHKGDNVADKVNKNMLMRLETDKTNCYVGEPITATYKLYTRLKSESKLTENPSFNGFSVIDLTNPDNSNFTREKLDGREYNVYTIRKAQLYPLQPGNIELEPAELENNIEFIKDEYIARNGNSIPDLFDDFTRAAVPPDGIINQAVTLKSKPVTILVKPLPEANKPANFNGSVGKFSIEAHLQQTNFPANEPGKLIVVISGSGNIQLLTAPAISWPDGIEPFDPKVSEELNKAIVPVTGQKTFEYSFSVDAPGNFSLPEIKFSYFDPVSASYKQTSVSPLSFTVTKATGPPAIDTSTIKTATSVSGINKIFQNRWWIIVFIAVVVIGGLIFWAIKDNKQNTTANAETSDVEVDEILEHIVEAAAVNQQNPLEKTEACLYQDDCSGFYSLLHSELNQYLSHKFSVPLHEINSKTIGTLLDRNNIKNETALQLEQLLAQVEWRRYTPFERDEQMNVTYQQAQDIVQEINMQKVRHL